MKKNLISFSEAVDCIKSVILCDDIIMTIEIQFLSVYSLFKALVDEHEIVFKQDKKL